MPKAGLGRTVGLATFGFLVILLMGSRSVCAEEMFLGLNAGPSTLHGGWGADVELGWGGSTFGLGFAYPLERKPDDTGADESGALGGGIYGRIFLSDRALEGPYVAVAFSRIREVYTKAEEWEPQLGVSGLVGYCARFGARVVVNVGVGYSVVTSSHEMFGDAEEPGNALALEVTIGGRLF